MITMTIAWMLAHPFYALPFALWVFHHLFASYSSFGRIRSRGEFARMHWSQRAYFVAMYAPALLVGYPLDIAVRATFGWALFRDSPFSGGWRFWTYTWTYTALVNEHINDFGQVGEMARWWGQVINAIMPGHIKTPSAQARRVS